MKLSIKKILLLLITGVVLIILIALFVKIFSFEDDKKEIDQNEINEIFITKLYNYIPKSTYYSTVYSGNYTSKELLNNDAKELMTYNYLEENKLIDKLVKKEDFDKALKEVFGDDIVYNPRSIQISPQTSLIFEKETFSKSDKKVIEDKGYAIFYDKVLYTVMADKTIIITDYYLKCNKTTKICYNTEEESEKNSYYTYSDDLKSRLNKDNLKKYNHTFAFKDGKYYWKSSDNA